MTRFPSLDKTHHFFALSWLLIALHVTTFTSLSQYRAPGTALWTLATTATYSAFYLLPALLLGYLARGVIGRASPIRGGAYVAVTLIALTGLTHALLFADRMIHSMYGFHINGFVLDLVLAPGGIASLGASVSTQITAGAPTAPTYTRPCWES